MRRLLAFLLLGCGGSTPPPEANPTTPMTSTGPVFNPGEAVAYRIMDGSGRLLGRVHSRYDEQPDGDSSGGVATVVTRVAIGPPVKADQTLQASRTYEYATTLDGDRGPISFKRISSVDGRMTLAFKPKAIARVTDLSTDEVPVEAPKAALIPSEDLMLLALALKETGLEAGQSGRLPVRTPESLEADEWLVRMWSNAERETIVQLPVGKATLTGRGQVAEFTSRSGWTFQRMDDAGPPPRLLPVPMRHDYVRPSDATWVDKPMMIAVEGGQLAGVLSEPRLRSRWGKNIVPGVVFLSDITPTNRHGFTGGGDYGTWQVLDHLADQGFAVLRVDDRGVGASRSALPSEKVTVETRLGDAIAMVRAMRREPTVDPEKIFVIGHGWGGVEALMVAKTEAVSGVVLLATPYRSAAEVLGERAAAILGSDPTAGRVDMRNVIMALKGQASDAPDRLVAMHRPFAGRVTSYANLDVPSIAKGVKAPVALFQGLKDFEVS